MRYKAIIFDFFGVICSEVSPFWLARHFGESEARHVKSTLVHAADIGEISQEEMLRELGAMTNTHPQQILREWFDYVKIDIDVLNAIYKLKSGFSVGLLTNSPSNFVRSILESQKIDTAFDAIVVSSEERCAKPEPKIYQLMLSRLSVSAHEAILIDDNPDNIAGAALVGMQGIVFSSIGQLELAMHEVFASILIL